jgi:casein kinase II subunit alpha
MIQQARFFGPFPVSYEDFIDADQNKALAMIMSRIEEQKSRRPFQLLQDKEVTAADKVFLCKVMRMDPRERPTARQLLEDEWFDEP